LALDRSTSSRPNASEAACVDSKCPARTRRLGPTATQARRLPTRVVSRRNGAARAVCCVRVAAQAAWVRAPRPDTCPVRVWPARCWPPTGGSPDTGRPTRRGLASGREARPCLSRLQTPPVPPRVHRPLGGFGGGRRRGVAQERGSRAAVGEGLWSCGSSPRLSRGGLTLALKQTVAPQSTHPSAGPAIGLPSGHRVAGVGVDQQDGTGVFS